ncbi:MAG: hypothetical protein ACR2JC_08830 [Chloroflexota bacterium]
MRHQDQQYDYALTQALATHTSDHIPATTDLWEKVEARLAERTAETEVRVRARFPRPSRRAGAVILGWLLVATAGLTAAAAASPHVRDTLTEPLSGMGISISSDNATVTGASPSVGLPHRQPRLHPLRTDRPAVHLPPGTTERMDRVHHHG